MRDRWTILTLLGAGAFMLWAAATYTVFDDEAFSCRRYTMPPGEMVSALWHGEEPDPPLYYVLQNLWVRVFGVGPLGLRSLSILFFFGGLVLIRSAGTAWYDAATGRAVMFLCALHPAHLFFGMAGRWYSAMFCIVALLLWAAGRSRNAVDPREALRWIVLWSIAATAACYTNYFGPVVAGLTWLAALGGVRLRKAWIGAGVFAALLYLPWLKPFIHQIGAFPSVGGGIMPYLSCAGRTAVALAAGNLASPTAWWVWGPMTAFAACLGYLSWRDRVRLQPLLIITLGCLVAGIASRVMIDKYVMTFSGAACLLAAAAMTGARGAASKSPMSETRTQGKLALGLGDARMVRRTAGIALVLAWIGCGVNLVTQRHWSSLRWLDPFENAIAEWRADPSSPPTDNWVLDHPSARYYFALAECRAAGATWRIAPAAWREIADLPDGRVVHDGRTATSAVMLKKLDAAPPDTLLTLRASGFTDDPPWQALQERLRNEYQIAAERTYLLDPDAALKDRLDPRHEHPAYRITVRTWRRMAN